MVVIRRAVNVKCGNILGSKAWILISPFQYPWVADELTPIRRITGALTHDTTDLVSIEGYSGSCTRSSMLSVRVYEIGKQPHSINRISQNNISCLSCHRRVSSRNFHR